MMKINAQDFLIKEGEKVKLKQRPKPQKFLLRQVIEFTVIWLSFLALYAPQTAYALESFSAVQTAYSPSDAWLLSREGEVLQQLRLNHQVRRLAWVKLEEISPALLRALIMAEDQHFYAHSGVDWSAVAAAGWRNLWNSKTRGASTLTMQLAGLLTEKAHAGRRGILEKTTQTARAIVLEHTWQKAEILEAYLNLVSFRGELQGIGALSFALFDKAPSALSQREAALAAVLIRSPNATPSVVASRACKLLGKLYQANECADMEGFVALKLKPPFAINLPDKAPHLAQRLLKIPGQTVKSTLNRRLQQAAFNSLQQNLLRLDHRNVQDGAVLVLDNHSGEVLAWVGSSGSLSNAAEVDNVLAARQAGSTLKPFLYAVALEQKALTAASLLDDSPVRIATSAGYYVPQNYDKNFVGPVSMRMALGSSLNVPAVRTLLRVGLDAFHQRLQDAGFKTLTESADYYGYSLALGAADVRLLDLTNAYRSLANGGQWRDVVWQKTAVKAPLKQVTTPAVAAIVSNILSDNSARFYTFGLDSVLATPYWTAVKTGTSKDMRDNWCIGYSSRYTVGVWVGNSDGSPMHDVSGVAGAAPIWREMLDVLHGDQGILRMASRKPAIPAAVESREIRFIPAFEPPRRELYLAGTAQSEIIANDETHAKFHPDKLSKTSKSASQQLLARIAYPGTGTIIALDPEIPSQQQRVIFKATAGLSQEWQWQLDQRTLPATKAAVSWFPIPGKHVLVLSDKAGNTVDTVNFEVRGASLKSDKSQAR